MYTRDGSAWDPKMCTHKQSDQTLLAFSINKISIWILQFFIRHSIDVKSIAY